MFFIHFMYIYLLAGASCYDDVTSFKRTLDDMQQYYTPGKNFSTNYFDSLLKCMSKDDDLLIEAQNKGWQKIYQFAAGKAPNTRNNTWGSNP